MPRQKSSASRLPRWLKHHALLTVEAVLVVGLLQEQAQAWVMAQHVPGTVKTLFLMAMTVGLLGFLVVVVQGAIGRAIATAYDAIPAVPNAVLHGAAFVALFVLYAHLHGIRLP